MKKYYSILAAAAVLAAVSCEKEAPAPEDTLPIDNQEQTVTEQTLTNPVTLTFTANAAQTKVSLEGEGTSKTAVWDEGDQVKVIWYNEGESTMESTTVTVESYGYASTTFTATVQEADYYYAVYPATIEATLDGEDNFTVNFPNSAQAPTTFAGAAWYAAKTTKDAKDFAFHPISTVIKFKLDGSAVADPDQIYFRSMNGGLNRLHGHAAVTFATDNTLTVSPDPNATTPYDGAGNVTYNVSGEDTYYIPIPGYGTGYTYSAKGETSPGTTGTDGFILWIKKSGENHPAAYYSATVIQQPGKFYNIKSAVDSKIITDYYVATSSQGTGDGLNQTNAATLSDLKTNVPAFKYSGNIAGALLLNGATINFLAGTYSEPISAFNTNSSAPEHSYTIQGGIGGGTTTFTTTTAATFNNSKAVVTIKDISFSGCTTNPAAKISAGKVSFDNIHLTACSAKGFDLTGGTTIITRSFIHDFDASNNALVISETAVVTISETSFSDNSCTGQNGGPIRVAAGSVTIKDCSFEGNSCKNNANNYGGAIAVTTGNASLENCTFTGNKAQQGKGGAIGLGTAANLEVKDCKFIGNTCTGNSGGAVFIGNTYTGHAFFTGCTFTSNTTGSYYGAALHAANQNAANTSFLGINNCLFINNGGTHANNANINPMIPHVIMNSTLISQSSYCGGLTVRGGANANNGKYGGSLLLNNIISNEGDSKPALSTVNTSYWLRCNGYNYYSSALATGQQVFTSSDVVYQLTEGPSASSTNYTWDASTYAWTWTASDSQKESMASYTTIRGLVSDDQYNDTNSYVHDNAQAFLTWLESLEYEYSSTKYNAFQVDINGRPRNATAYWPGCYQND